MDNIQQRLTELFAQYPQLQSLRQKFIAADIDAWLVGGCLRDLLLSKEVVDVDIAVAGDPTGLAKQWAETVNGRWFWLDAERLQSRVLLPNQVLVDFAPLRAATIGGDQNLRDFTINSLAISLADGFPRQALLDPLNGVNDLKQRCLRFCSSRSIADDPLRMLKGIRHAVTLQMQLGAEAMQQIRAEAAAIKAVAGERIRDELGKILLTDTPLDGFELLLETGLLPVVFGPAGAGWNPAETFADLRIFDQNMKQQQAEVEADEPGFDEPYNSRSLFLLATLLRGYQPANLPDLLHDKLRLSRQQQRIVSSLQQPPDSQWLARLPQISSVRQKALLVESLGFFPVEQLIYWALYRQLLPLAKVYDLLEAYQSQQRLGRVPDLLNGNQLAELLQTSGKQIGHWQERLKQAELADEISDADGAVSWLKSKISD